MTDESQRTDIDWEAVWRSLDWESKNDALAARTLALRAEKYARLAEDVDATGDDALMVLLFSRAGERYAIPIDHVLHVLDAPTITPLPCVPDYYRGVINLRGRILTVFDLRRFWGLQAADPAAPTLIIVSAAALTLALLADEVLDFASIPAGNIAPPTVTGGGPTHQLQGITTDGVAILDVEKLLADQRLIVQGE